MSQKVNRLIVVLHDDCPGDKTSFLVPYLNVCSLFSLLIGNIVGFLGLLRYLAMIAIITCSAILMTAGLATALMDAVV